MTAVPMASGRTATDGVGPGASPQRLLVAGVGNVFAGDDAFGLHVVRRLATLSVPAGVRVREFGIRGVELAYTLLEGWGGVILVDAVSRGAAPGTLFVIEPQTTAVMPLGVGGHGFHPAEVLDWVRAVGACPAWLRLVGCEPAVLEAEGGEPIETLSPAVEAAVDPAVELVQSLLSERAAHA